MVLGLQVGMSPIVEGEVVLGVASDLLRIALDGAHLGVAQKDKAAKSERETGFDCVAYTKNLNRFSSAYPLSAH